MPSSDKIWHISALNPISKAHVHSYSVAMWSHWYVTCNIPYDMCRPSENYSEARHYSRSLVGSYTGGKSLLWSTRVHNHDEGYKGLIN